jgi:hypothetical protein
VSATRIDSSYVGLNWTKLAKKHQFHSVLCRWRSWLGGPEGPDTNLGRGVMRDSRRLAKKCWGIPPSTLDWILDVIGISEELLGSMTNVCHIPSVMKCDASFEQAVKQLSKLARIGGDTCACLR